MNLLDFCKQNGDISLYGYGVYGHIIKKYLEDNQISISSIIISDNQETVKEAGVHIPVFHLSEWIENYTSGYPGILITVSEIYQDEIISNLRSKGISQYYVVPNSYVDIRKIGIIDTTVGVINHGNEIIMQAVYKHLLPLYEKDFLYKFHSLDDFGLFSMKFMRRCQYIFVGGTNALNSCMDHERYLGINDKNAESIRNKIVLCGVGWLRYEEAPNSYTRKLLQEVLSCDFLHSVRDSYTEKKLRSMGIENVVNTGCPTIWGFTQEHCKQIPTQKAEQVLLMLTPNNYKQDTDIVQIVRNNYKKIFFWVQGDADYSYIKALCPEAVQVPSQLSALEDFLKRHKKIDYVGTRLHGGIKCLQNKKRSIIVAIDNRAIEMKKDFNLPIVLPEEKGDLEKIIQGEFKTEVHLPKDNIRKWLSQFMR